MAGTSAGIALSRRRFLAKSQRESKEAKPWPEPKKTLCSLFVMVSYCSLQRMENAGL